MELSPELLFVLGVVASLAVWILKAVFVSKDKEIPTWVYSIVLGVVAFGLALAFVPVVLPPFPSHDGSVIGIAAAVVAFVGAALPAVAAIVAAARVIYEVLLQKVLDGLAARIKKALKGSEVG